MSQIKFSFTQDSLVSNKFCTQRYHCFHTITLLHVHTYMYLSIYVYFCIFLCVHTCIFVCRWHPISRHGVHKILQNYSSATLVAALRDMENAINCRIILDPRHFIFSNQSSMCVFVRVSWKTSWFLSDIICSFIIIIIILTWHICWVTLKLIHF